MRCPFCDSKDSYVRDSREINNGKSIRRRRECTNCQKRFSTFENIIVKNLIVIKRNGTKKNFDPQKMTKSIETAMRKRAHKQHQIEEIVGYVTSFLENNNQKEVNSRFIGKLIMQELAKIDQVAYIRFASVYHDFNNIADFAKFIRNITQKLL
jgi:transcriptional repressor NrdR